MPGCKFLNPMSSYERIMMAPTCRFINAPSLVSPDLSFNEISILVFCCAFRGDMSLEVIQECSRIYGLSGVLGIFANNSRVTPLDTNHLSNLLLREFGIACLSESPFSHFLLSLEEFEDLWNPALISLARTRFLHDLEV